jgi:hypothetical protein
LANTPFDPRSCGFGFGGGLGAGFRLILSNQIFCCEAQLL